MKVRESSEIMVSRKPHGVSSQRVIIYINTSMKTLN